MRKLLSIIMSIAVAVALLTGSIALPIIVRPFYYAHIEPLELERKSGLTREEIIVAYDEVLDFCTGVTDEFSAGVLPFSESGASHFADCRKLFILDFAVFGTAMLVIAAIKLMERKVPIHRFKEHSPSFYGAVGIGAVLAAAGVLAAADFDRAFVVFHSLFFPGKDNWIFSAAQDPVIRIMPEAFFRNCALLILAALLCAAAVIIFADMKKRKRVS